jgi:hypothetical protein
MLLDWVRQGEYDRIIGGEYLRKGEEPPLRAETDAAQAHYSERIGDAFSQAGSSIAEAGDQFAKWLARQRGSGGPVD